LTKLPKNKTAAAAIGPNAASSNFSELRRLIASRALAPFDQLDTTAKHFAGGFRGMVDDILLKGFERDGITLPSIKPPIPFDEFNRSFCFHIHAWEPLTFLLQAHSQFGDAKYLDASFEFASDWFTRYQAPLLALPRAEALEYAAAHKKTQAWYDMGVGQRAYRLAYLIDAIARLPDKYSDDAIGQLYEALQFHHQLLSNDSFFVGHTNHGLYQALGQLAAAHRFRSLEDQETYYEIASRRLHAMIDSSFFPSATHREHSPGYHHMILGSLLGARRSKLLDAQLDTFLGEAESVMSWMIAPDGSLANFGDTDHKKRVYSPPHPLEYEDKHIKYLWSGGRGGIRPDPGMKHLADAGYVFSRTFHDGEPVSKASYFAQAAGFHSRTHKHADHLTFLWHDGGRQIIADPGRYAYAGRTEVGSDLFEQGFWYADPKRIYVESTRAHNCVEIDGASYRRKGARRFGSALRYAAEQDGLAVTDCEVTHQRTVRHRRVLVMAPGRFLLVLDWLNDRTQSHDYRQWFQFAPDWQVQRDADGLIARAAAQGDAAAQTVRVFNLIDDNSFAEPVRGQAEPQLQGWWSDAAYSLVPSPSVCVEALSRPMARFATLFALEPDIIVDMKATRFNATLRSGKVRWSDKAGKHLLTVTMAEPGIVSIKLEKLSWMRVFR
jgi:Heparinase II/III-like protein/Heparinase II/III N-terminus